MAYGGFYINLDRSLDRRREMEAEIARYNLATRYTRHFAADGNSRGFPVSRLNAGETGCFTSHYEALAAMRGTGQHVHIVEDDVIFASCTENVIGRIVASGEIDAFDILYADIALPLSSESFREFKVFYDDIVVRDGTGALKSAVFQILPLNPFMSTAASSYIVNKNAIGKISGLMQDELARGAQLPVDAFLFDKIRAGALKAGFIFPFITSIRVEHVMHSTVRAVPDITKKFTAANIARYSFFIGCDFDECARLAATLPLSTQEDRHVQILARVLAFSVTGNGSRKKAN